MSLLMKAMQPIYKLIFKAQLVLHMKVAFLDVNLQYSMTFQIILLKDTLSQRSSIQMFRKKGKYVLTLLKKTGTPLRGHSIIF
jgi:hypothetical protein